jgi:1-phosphatidylinositol-4-phosphate 5-kinase
MATTEKDTPTQGLFFTPPVKVFPIAPESTLTFKFKDYYPLAFHNLREHFGINDKDYVTSLCQNWNEVSTPGKSGSLFFFSQDNQYVLKTIPKREAKLLRLLLPSYYHHMMQHDNSLLTRFLGLHRVKPHKGRQVRFLVMGNLFKTSHKIHQRFDLKGSTAGRELTPEERNKKNPTFKDMDFRRLNKKIQLGPKMRALFLNQLSEDCKFLMAQNVMDYSLLVGIHYGGVDDQDSASSSAEEEEFHEPLNLSTSRLPPVVPNPRPAPRPPVQLSIFEQEEGGIRARVIAPEGDEQVLDEYYYMGIIDILTLYSLRKQFEHAYKSVVTRGDISTVNPTEYAARFLKFIGEVTT